MGSLTSYHGPRVGRRKGHRRSAAAQKKDDVGRYGPKLRYGPTLYELLGASRVRRPEPKKLSWNMSLPDSGRLKSSLTFVCWTPQAESEEGIPERPGKILEETLRAAEWGGLASCTHDFAFKYYK